MRLALGAARGTIDGSMDGWKIPRAPKDCAELGCSINAGQEFYAVLDLDPFARRDLCAVCFSRMERSDQRPPIFWKSRRRTPGGKNTGPVLDLTALRVLFDRLGEAGDDEKARGLRYFVSLLLLRKRVLKLVDAMTPAQEAADLVVIDPKVQGMAPVALTAPDLDNASLETLEADLMAALSDQPPEGDGEVEAEGQPEAPAEDGSEDPENKEVTGPSSASETAPSASTPAG